MGAHKTKQCKRGHRWTKANTYVYPNGDRMCRACNTQRSRSPEALERRRTYDKLPHVRAKKALAKKAWYLRNKARVRAANKRWKATQTRTELNARAYSWNERNPEKFKAIQDKWRKKNMHKILAYQKARRRKLSAV